MRVIILYKRFTRRALPFGFIQTKASPFFHGRRSLCSRLSRLPRLIVSPKWSVFRRFVLTQVLEWDFLKWSSVCLAAVAGVSDRKRRGVLAFIARFFRFPLCLLSVLFFVFVLLVCACKCWLFGDVRCVIPTVSLPAAMSPRKECYLAGGNRAFA